MRDFIAEMQEMWASLDPVGIPKPHPMALTLLAAYVNTWVPCTDKWRFSAWVEELKADLST